MYETFGGFNELKTKNKKQYTNVKGSLMNIYVKNTNNKGNK